MADDLGLRERKKRQTRAALSRTAFELCAERGVDEVTVADIAAGANVSTRTFFNYFSSKEEAIVGATDRADRLVELVAERPEDEPLWDALRAAVAGVIDDGDVPQRDLLARARIVLENPALAQQQVANWMAMERSLVTEVARRTGTDEGDLHPRLVVAVAVGAVRVAMDHWIDTPSDRSLAETIDAALLATADGLRGGVAVPVG